MHARRRDEHRQAGLAGLAGRAALPSSAVRVSVETRRLGRRRGGAGRSGLAEITEQDGGASAVLGDRPPEQVVAALVAAGVAGARASRWPSPPGGRLRRADRGGFRCQRLSPGRAVGARSASEIGDGVPPAPQLSCCSLVLAAIPIIIGVAVKLTSRGSATPGGLIGSITDNGLFVGVHRAGGGAPDVPADGGVGGGRRLDRRRGQYRHAALPAGGAGQRTRLLVVKFARGRRLVPR